MLIHDYAIQGNFTKIKNLLDNGTSVEEKDEYGYTALILASLNEHFDIVKYLVQHNASVHEKNNYGFTAIMMSNNFYIIKYLIKCGASINEQSKSRDTALMHAVYMRRLDIVKLLIKHGALIGTICSFGNHALKKAKLYECFEIINFLNKIILKRIKCL